MAAASAPWPGAADGVLLCARVCAGAGAAVAGWYEGSAQCVEGQGAAIVRAAPVRALELRPAAALLACIGLLRAQ